MTTNKVVANALKALNGKTAHVEDADNEVWLVDDETDKIIKRWKGYSNRNVMAAFAYGKKMGYKVDDVISA